MTYDPKKAFITVEGKPVQGPPMAESNEALTIQWHWLNFACQIMPENASQIQHNEMKRSYYAGFYDCLRYMNQVIAEMSEDDGVAKLQALSEEAEWFFKDYLNRELNR